MNKPNINEIIDISFSISDDIHQYHHYNNETIYNFTLYHHEFKNCLFENNVFEHTLFEQCYFMNVIFQNCDLSHMINCKLLGIDFFESMFDDVLFKDCHCHYMSLYDMKNKTVHFNMLV